MKYAILLSSILLYTSLSQADSNTPLAGLSDPDERAMCCQLISGTALTSMAAKGGAKRAIMTEMLQAMQTAKSWKAEINRMHPDRRARQVIVGKASAHFNRYVAEIKQTKSLSHMEAQGYVSSLDLKNCAAELVSYKKRKLAKPTVVAKTKPVPPTRSKHVSAVKPKPDNSAKSNNSLQNLNGVKPRFLYCYAALNDHLTYAGGDPEIFKRHEWDSEMSRHWPDIGTRASEFNKIKLIYDKYLAESGKKYPLLNDARKEIAKQIANTCKQTLATIKNTGLSKTTIASNHNKTKPTTTKTAKAQNKPTVQAGGQTSATKSADTRSEALKPVQKQSTVSKQQLVKTASNRAGAFSKWVGEPLYTSSKLYIPIFA